MKSKYLIILIGLLFQTCSNEEPEIVPIRLDRTNWFKYETGDTLIFKNNTSTTDTYIIDTIYSFYIGSENTYRPEEVLDVVYEGLSQCDNCPIRSFMRTPDGTLFDGKFPTGYPHPKDTTIDYKLGDTIIHDVYIVEDILTDSVYFIVKALYYSHDYGYIRYDMYDDRVYELQLE